ncbi:MAG: mercury methylation corrinoid protein HgcA [Bacteroidales bacterium]|nr:mercury methylation corrinoid protein HgcA [Bacteroidales bacterium]
MGKKKKYIISEVETGVGAVPVVSTSWSTKDRWDTLKVRWSVGRMKYKVMPGLYATGHPDQNSQVFVSANYKLSFDHLRRALNGLNAWTLALDTKGINVWCAAGKGTFSTKEVVRRIRIHHLDQIVDHRKIILPQLSATGVAAHEVKKMTGFSVVYGPIKAVDIKTFIENGLKASAPMRLVKFPLAERLKLIPVDIFYGRYYLVIVPALFFVLSGFFPGGFSTDRMLSTGWKTTIDLFAGYLAGCALTPALLPWIPFRRFSRKGLTTGWLIAILLAFFGMLGTSVIEIVSWFLMIGGLASFMAMNFTGSSTYTSISGVQKEMKTALPVQVTMTSLGLAGWILTRFFTI